MKMKAANIFVLGMEESNRSKLEALARHGEYVFHPLLSVEEVTAGSDFSLDDRLEAASRVVEESPGGADAIIGYWDFPVSAMAPMLCRRFGLRTPSLESVLRCEHKYWSRLEQRASVPEHAPPFEAVDPFDDRAVANIGLPFPFWLKPVKSFASHLGFRIRSPRDLRHAIPKIRSGITGLGSAFNQFLDRADVPEAVRRIDGFHCVAEGIISGLQCTLEGFVHRGEVEIYGVVDSIRYPNRSTFARYEYPSRLPARVKERMAEIARCVAFRMELDSTPFNMEFLWDGVGDRIWIVEINPRISQSHGDLFEKVDGVPNHKVVVDLALGRRPEWRRGAGPYRRAGKFFLRRFGDAQVVRVPSRQEVERLEREVPGTLVEITARPGARLSDMDPQEQDSYSFNYARLFVGASDRRELLHRFRRIAHELSFTFAALPEPAPPSRDGIGGRKNVFLLGLNEFNRSKLERVSSAEECRFHGLLEEPHDYDLPRYLERAEAVLRRFPGSIDAIVAYMDFPVSTMLPVLARRFGVRSASLESVLRCEHKFWSRLSQQEVIPEHVPRFCLVDPFDDESVAGISLPYPFWIKPVKSAASYLGFRVGNRRDLARAIEAIRAGIGQLAEPFNFVLRHADLPPEIEGADGYHCIAEEIILGRECTLEGWVHRGEMGYHGIVDSIREPNHSTFARYEYPSTLPKPVRAQIAEVGRRILDHVGLDDSGFNMEFQWDRRRDRLTLVEINTRVAQHHSDLFEKVDGVTNHEVAIQVALDRKPRVPRREGSFNRAATFFLRRYQDAEVVRTPDARVLEEIQERIPGTVIQLQVKPGMRLSELFEQDSYSYALAIIYIGARNQPELLERYRSCVADLDFEFGP